MELHEARSGRQGEVHQVCLVGRYSSPGMGMLPPCLEGVMQPYLTTCRFTPHLTLIALQVFANITIVIIDKECPSDKHWFAWRGE